jgi:hypothetical protein
VSRLLVAKKDLSPAPGSEIENARISSAFLGVEDHGIFTFSLMLDFDGSGQGFGQYGLDEWSKAQDDRVGIGYGIDVLKAILEVVGVEEWGQLKGKLVRARHTHSEVSAIGHALRDQWLDPKHLWALWEKRRGAK